MLRQHSIEISVARREDPRENGYAERLIRTLKEEEVHLNTYHDIHEVRDRIGRFITQVPNKKRPHVVLGYLTPVELEQKTCLNWTDFGLKEVLALQQALHTFSF